MPQKPHVLAIAYVYPPDAGSGTFRTLYFMNNLAAQGYRIAVLTARREDFHPGASVDEALLAEVHPAIEVIRCSVKRPAQLLTDLKNRFVPKRKAPLSPAAPSAPGGAPGGRGCLAALKDNVSALLTCPDQHAGWIPDVLRKGREYAGSRKVGVIYASGGPWSCIVAGALLHKLTGIPLVLDFRDPWVGNPNFANRPRLARRLEEAFESFAVRCAARLVANTEELRRDFLARYRGLDPSATRTITNGFERIERAGAGAGAGPFTLVHAGELYLSRNPLGLLQAVERLIRGGDVDRERFRVRFVGGISIEDRELAALLASPHLEGVVELFPRVPHQEAISLQLEASVLLLIQPGFPVQIPRKLFEYLSLQKPVLAITEASSATGNLIRKQRLGVVVENSTAAIGAALLDLYLLWEQGKLQPPDPEALLQFQNAQLAQRLAALLEETAAS